MLEKYIGQQCWNTSEHECVQRGWKEPSKVIGQNCNSWNMKKKIILMPNDSLELG